MDLRIDHIFREEMDRDTSFQEKESGLSLLFGRKTYSKQEMRETWHMGIRHGIEIGLRRCSLEGQRIELNSNTTSEKHREYLEKFYMLASEYNCGIKYHPEFGMVIVDIQNH